MVATATDTDILYIKIIVVNWLKTKADPFGMAAVQESGEESNGRGDAVGSKRRRASGEAKKSDKINTASAPKKRKGADGKAIPVETLAPIPDGRWYLGEGGFPFYVRRCVRDLGRAIMKQIKDEDMRKRSATCWVITGASGIGKSWSINAFVVELLRAGLEVFFHSGTWETAWLISKSKEEAGVSIKPHRVSDIERMSDPNVVYVYDSPGSKVNLGPHAQARRRINVGVSLIFSPPKERNYNYAVSKTNGRTPIMKNLPSWSKRDMHRVRGKKHEDVVNRCYSVWGGNMRALDNFIETAEYDGVIDATKKSTEQLQAQIERIDKDMADKMSKRLEKQVVNNAFGVKDFKDAPGQILTPEPLDQDPSNRKCFEEFNWRFCSPIAEEMFMEHAKKMGKGVVMDLLKSVFDVPSPKGVLFEKAVHFLITNGLVPKFSWCNYNKREGVEFISFPECKVKDFELDKLKDGMKEALEELHRQPLSGRGGVAVALGPTSTSFDAVDMFVLVKKGETGTTADWHLYLLQDTIARKHSLHPMMVLWYCSLFNDAFGEVLPEVAKNGSVLACCKYVPVVPHKSKDTFQFEKPDGDTSKFVWEDVEKVAELLGEKFPKDIHGGLAKLKSIIEEKNLEIPPTAKNQKRKLNKTVVGNAILKNPAEKNVKEMAWVMFDVLNCSEEGVPSPESKVEE